ncbi:MAG: zf-TFIIB domain-containing protein [Candidatus Bathyarchaeia archaeon]
MKCPECGFEMVGEFNASVTVWYCNKCGCRFVARNRG